MKIKTATIVRIVAYGSAPGEPPMETIAEIPSFAGRVLIRSKMLRDIADVMETVKRILDDDSP